ncbi:hypothetical protein AB1W24_13805 [Bordetella avium]|uniref:OB-fold protein n=1 Tax=Bordetella avium TaxID=521 RepID=UPI00345BB75D
MKPTPFLALAILYATTAYPASFDCSKARSIPERLICSTPELSAADDHLKIIFDAARSKSETKEQLDNMARQAWRWREQNCRDIPCLRQWYQDQRQAYSSASKVEKATNISNSPPKDGYRAGPPLGAERLRPESNVAPAFPENRLSAEELYRAFDANQVAADMKFKGKQVTVEGNIEEIGIAFDGNPYVELEVRGQFLATVRLNFPKAMSPRLAELRGYSE